MSGGSNAPSAGSTDSLGAVATTVMSAWLRLAEAYCRNVVQLVKAPLELLEPEDPTLGIFRTSIWIRPPEDGPGAAAYGGAAISCGSVKVATTGVVVSATVDLQPMSLDPNGKPTEVVVQVPTAIAPGLYEITIEVAADEPRQHVYVIPFGIPV